MRRNTYVRLLSYPLPPAAISVPLARIAQTGEAVGMLEGRLLADIQVSQGIRLQADYRTGATTVERITSTPVIRIEPGFVLTDDFLYQIVRIPADPKLSAPAAKPETLSNKTVIPRSRYDHLCDQLFRQMQELEPALVHIQALSRIHEAELARVRGDIIDPLTHEAITPVDMHRDFTLLLEGLRYYYCTEEGERNQCTANLWVSGHRVLAAVWGAIIQEQEFLLDKGYLPLFSDAYAKLSRLFKAITHISTLKPEGADDAPAY